jgi:hypothetical protein
VHCNESGHLGIKFFSCRVLIDSQLVLCSAFLVGLAMVGLLALAVAVLGLFRYPRRHRRRGAVEHQVVRYP